MLDLSQKETHAIDHKFASGKYIVGRFLERNASYLPTEAHFRNRKAGDFFKGKLRGTYRVIGLSTFFRCFTLWNLYRGSLIHRHMVNFLLALPYHALAFVFFIYLQVFVIKFSLVRFSLL